MNWILELMVYMVAVLIAAVVSTVTAKSMKVEISGSTGDKIGMVVISMALHWSLLLVYLELSGAKITWPN